ncbi:inovirus Gp2 family protein [Providencia stuartii]|uniref:inovirus Gp2 family protein n=1 Tax=Providencia TaxID=586 RepID=UPI0023497A64|nr:MULTISPECIES: inovirus Gp2 family protein [Providencia]MCR4081972.1 inovirus Gp2 family protein [Providencia stuartii]
MSKKLNQHYVNQINRTINKALAVHKRLTAIHLDLRFPITPEDVADDSTAITRFFESLKAKIKNDLKKKKEAWKRNLSCELHYCWVKEIGEKNKQKHYHVMLLLNKDIYHSLGDFKKESGTLYVMLQQAWCSAIKIGYLPSRPLVNIAGKNVTHLYRVEQEETKDGMYTYIVTNQSQNIIVNRIRYLAKLHTKFYVEGERSFGCSR